MFSCMKHCGICIWTKRLNIALHQDIIARYTQIVKNILQGISINVSFPSFKISGELAYRKSNNPLIFGGNFQRGFCTICPLIKIIFLEANTAYSNIQQVWQVRLVLNEEKTEENQQPLGKDFQVKTQCVLYRWPNFLPLFCGSWQFLLNLSKPEPIFLHCTCI